MIKIVYSIKLLFFCVLLMNIMTLKMSFAQNFWERVPSPTTNFLRTLHFEDSLKGWIAGDSGVVFYTSDGGVNWIQQETNTQSRIMRLFFLDSNRAWALAWADEASGDKLFYGTEILKTSDGGLNWNVSQYREENTFLRGIYFLDTLRGFMGGVPGIFLETFDGGQNWSSANIDSGTFSHFPVIDFNFYNNLYGFACGGRFDIAGVIWKTTNNGNSWSPIPPQYSPADEVWDIHFFDSLNVLGIGGDPDQYGVGLIRSTDAGNSWYYFEIGVFGQALAISFRTANEGWAVVPQVESFVTTFDYANNWTSFITPDSTRLYDVQFTDSLTGYAVGEGGAIVKYKFQKPDDVMQDEVYSLDDFVLYQNYPNPFNSSTTISYRLSKASQISIKIYNVLGNQLTTLRNGYSTSGDYEVTWQANNEPSGIYYVQLNVNGFISTKKMVLLK